MVVALVSSTAEVASLESLLAGAGWHTSLREAAPDTLDLALSADPQPAVEWDSASRARIAMLLSVGSFDSALLLEGIVARLKDQGVRVIVVAPPLTEPSARQLVARVMRAGADDFVIATSAKDELLLRVEALAWRRRSLREQRHQSIYGIRVDRAARRLCHNAGHVTLTPCEFRVFSCLARCAGRPVARGSIQQSLARQSRSHTKNLVDVYILYLRRKTPPGLRVCDSDRPWRRLCARPNGSVVREYPPVARDAR